MCFHVANWFNDSSARARAPLATALAGGAGVAMLTTAPAAGVAMAQTASPGSRQKFRYGMVIDTRRCVGCRACVVACKAENKTPPDVFYNTVLEDAFPARDDKPVFTTKLCFHCEKPPCVEPCPVEPPATYKRERDGIVVIDYDRCIGCGLCVEACPYGSRSLDSGESYPASAAGSPWAGVPSPEYGQYRLRRAGTPPIEKARKCTFCLHLQDAAGRYDKGAGRWPACAKTCTGRAIFFGDLTIRRARSRCSLRQRRPVSTTCCEELAMNTTGTYVFDEKVGRRIFLKAGAATAGAAATGVTPSAHGADTPSAIAPDPAAAKLWGRGAGQWIPSCCNMCGGQSGVLVHVVDGVAEKIEPNPWNPNNYTNISADFFTGYTEAYGCAEGAALCAKGNAGIAQLYDPDRVKRPLKRTTSRQVHRRGPEVAGDLLGPGPRRDRGPPQDPARRRRGARGPRPGRRSAAARSPCSACAGAWRPPRGWGSRSTRETPGRGGGSGPTRPGRACRSTRSRRSCRAGGRW